MNTIANRIIFKRKCHQHINKFAPFIKKMNKINNDDYISCNGCIYFLPNTSNNSSSGLCKRFIKQDFDSEFKEYTSVYISRSHFELCGPEAYHKVIDLKGKFLGP
jgi:hypothetical protein